MHCTVTLNSLLLVKWDGIFVAELNGLGKRRTVPWLASPNLRQLETALPSGYTGTTRALPGGGAPCFPACIKPRSALRFCDPPELITSITIWR